MQVIKATLTELITSATTEVHVSKCFILHPYKTSTYNILLLLLLLLLLPLLLLFYYHYFQDIVFHVPAIL